jgi:hypothetical protein
MGGADKPHALSLLIPINKGERTILSLPLKQNESHYGLLSAFTIRSYGRA